VRSVEGESLATDVYLDELLARRGGARPVVLVAPASVPLSIRASADLLDRSLPRFHPSFRFEERLAGRLRTDAEGRGTVVGRGATLASGPVRMGGDVVPFPGVTPAFGASRYVADRRARSLLVGGAIASGVSLAGAAFAGAKLRARRRGRATGMAAGATSEGAR
jgi:hypothetical protein